MLKSFQMTYSMSNIALHVSYPNILNSVGMFNKKYIYSLNYLCISLSTFQFLLHKKKKKHSRYFNSKLFIANQQSVQACVCTFLTETRHTQGSRTPVPAFALILQGKDNLFLQRTQFAWTVSLENANTHRVVNTRCH